MCLGQGPGFPSLPAPAPRFRRHSSYAVVLGQEPNLKSTFARVGGAGEGSPITIKHCCSGLLWVALLVPETGLGVGDCFHRPWLSDPPGSRSSPGLGEGHRRSPHSPKAASSLFLDLGSVWFGFEIPVQQKFVFIA